MSNNGEDAKKYIDKEHSVVGSGTIVPAHYIMAQNDSWTVTKWQIIEVSTSKVVYTSGKYSRDEIFNFDLKDIAPYEQAEYILKASVDAGDDSTSDVTIQFFSNIANTAIFELTGTAFKTDLKYIPQF